ncbi:MAG: hypothetical protein GYA21_10260 [Myxococcales bacterium]|nr:hypothetical protein [Myxococcales bacterium]
MKVSIKSKAVVWSWCLLASFILFTIGAGCSSTTSSSTYSDEELTAILDMASEVRARVEALLASNANPTSDQLLQVIRDVPGVSASGTGEGAHASAWVELGSGKPIQWVMMDPQPNLVQPPPQAMPAPLPPPGQGNGKNYAFFNIAYASSVNSTLSSMLSNKGYVRTGGTTGTYNELRSLGTLKVLYISSHSTIPTHGPAVFSVMLADKLPPHEKGKLNTGAWPDAIRMDLHEGRLGFWTLCSPKQPICNDTLFFNDKFAGAYFSFEDDSLFFLDSCHSGSPSAEDFRNTLMFWGPKLTVYLGWSWEVTWPDGWYAANLFFDRWLGANQQQPVPDPPQRAFDAKSVLAEMTEKNLNRVIGEDGKISYLKVFPESKINFAGAPSIQLIQVKEKDQEMKIGGIFGKDPGSDRRKVKLAGQALEVKEWKEEEITCTLPKSSGGSQVDVEISADDHEGNKVQITEWTVKFKHEGHSEMKDTDTGEVFASSDGTYTFDVKFRADVHEYREEAGQEPMNKVIVPFEIEDDGSMSWSGTARFKDQTEPFSGTTSNLYDIDYTDPAWPGNLPADTDLLAGEGYIDMNTRKLYLFLVGVGDDSGSGTYNLGPQTDCQYEHDQYTNRVYLVFNLDENFEIENNSCTDQITDQDGQFTYSGTRSWEFTTRSPPDKDAAR